MFEAVEVDFFAEGGEEAHFWGFEGGGAGLDRVGVSLRGFCFG